MTTQVVPAARLGGSGPTVLLLHGYGADRQGWTSLVPSLLPLAQCWAPDLPGHGKSHSVVPASTLAGLAEQVDWPDGSDGPPVHLVGHSLGGALALLMAARDPARVASLTLLAPVGLGIGVKPEFLHGYPQLTHTADLLDTLQSLVFDPALIPASLASRTLGQLQAGRSRESLLEIAQAIQSGQRLISDAIGGVRAAATPRLIFWGQQDRINPHRAGDVDEFGGQWHVLPHCGHLPHLERRKPVADAIAHFLSTHG